MRARLCFGAALAATVLAGCRGPETITNNNFNFNVSGALGREIITIDDCQTGVAITSPQFPSGLPVALKVGDEMDVKVIQASLNACLPDQNFHWTAEPAGVVEVVKIDAVTGHIKAIAAGQVRICAIGDSRPEVRVCFIMTVTGGSNPVTIGPISTITTGTGCTRTFQGATIPAGVAGSWSVSGITGALVNTVTGAGSVPQGSSGTLTLTFTPTSGSPVSTQITVVSTNCTSSTVTSTPSFTLTNCSGFQATWNLAVFVNGSASTGTWSSSNTGVVTVNSSTGVATLTGTVGTAVITVQTSSGSATTTITVNQCQSSTVTVDVVPATFSLTVGQAPITLTCTVTAPAGQSTACTWSSNFVGTTNSAGACVSLSPQGTNQVIVSAIAGCTQQIEVRATAVANTSVSDVSVGTTSSGTVTCTITWNGTTTGTITVNVNQGTAVTASCTNQFGASFIPYWYTQKTGSSIMRIVGATTTITIGSTTWPAGPQATLTGVFQGTDSIVVQAAIADKTVLASRVVVVQ